MHSLSHSISIPNGSRSVSVQDLEGEFLHDWVLRRGPSRTLEVGLAYGLSAAYLLSAHSKCGGHHTALDPYQERDFQNVGLENIRTLELSEHFTFVPEPAHEALPRLKAEGQHFDLIFIDGGHLFDQTLVSFFHSHYLLPIGGTVMIHDTWMRSIQMVLSFIEKNRKEYRRLPSPSSNLAVLQKTDELDRREWDHFSEFYTLKSILAQPLVKLGMRLGLDRLFYK